MWVLAIVANSYLGWREWNRPAVASGLYYSIAVGGVQVRTYPLATASGSQSNFQPGGSRWLRSILSPLFEDRRRKLNCDAVKARRSTAGFASANQLAGKQLQLFDIRLVWPKPADEWVGK